MLISVFSFVVDGDWFCEGFITVVLLSFFCAGGFTTVVLLSFFSAGGLTVVSFCSQAASRAMPASRQIYLFIQMNRVSRSEERRVGKECKSRVVCVYEN